MKKQEELYKVDYNKMLLDAVKMIKEHCSKKQTCIRECQFYDNENGCLLNDYPEYWEV